MKITPCHDPNDFEVGLRHNLPQYLMLDGDGKITGGYKWDGMDRYEARKAIVQELEEQGYLVSIEPCVHNVGTCSRCHNDVEPLASDQWFVKMQPLAKEAIRVVEDGEIKFVPDRFAKTYLNWMNSVRDWCISRQLWWGWPDKTADLDYFYPTDVLVTGYDIIFFWVARMIFSGCEHMKKIPFHTVLIHGLIRDPQGKKMSKSAGNGVDPIEVINTYGADALRFNIITGNSPGNDMRFFPERCEAMRNFANKLWNASRFVMMNLTIDKNELPETLELEDKWILSRFNELAREVGENLDKYELGIAAQKIYDFIWDSFCDWYIELTKARLTGEDETARVQAQKVLLYVLTETLKLLHPFMPFITEEIYQALPHEGDALMVQPYPVYREDMAFPAESARFEKVMEAIRAIRSRRSEMNVPPSKRPHLYIVTEEREAFENGRDYLCRLAYAGEVIVSEDVPADADKMVSIVTKDARCFLPMSELVDLDKERERLEKELAKNRGFLENQRRKLSNESFVSRAPANVVATERERAEKLEALIANLEESLRQLG